jgi:hypothetical protein
MFWVALLVNGRAAFKLLLDWKGMLTTCRFVERAYESLASLPDEAGARARPARTRLRAPRARVAGARDRDDPARAARLALPARQAARRRRGA